MLHLQLQSALCISSNVGGKQPPAPEPLEEDLPPEDWDGSIQSMALFITKMEDHFPEDARRSREQLEELSFKMRTPLEEKDVVFRAVRIAVLKCAQGVEDRAGEVLEECIERFSQAKLGEEVDDEAKEEQESLKYDPEVRQLELPETHNHVQPCVSFHQQVPV